MSSRRSTDDNPTTYVGNFSTKSELKIKQLQNDLIPDL